MSLDAYVKILTERAKDYAENPVVKWQRIVPLSPERIEAARALCREGYSLYQIQDKVGIESYDQVQKACSGIPKSNRHKVDV